MKSSFYRKYGKRIFDLSIVILTAPLLLPLTIFLAIFVRLKIGKPVLFRQKRAGYRGEIFKLAKFRSMTEERDSNGEMLSDYQRLVPFGKFLRESSLDELPGLFQVITGKMSLVGPRPLLPEYLELYSDFQNRRHEVLPGITGWAQINGRNAITWNEKFILDVDYVDQQSFWVDVKILLLTVIRVFKRDNINASQEEPMARFTGNCDSKK